MSTKIFERFQQATGQSAPPRIMIYGEPGVGKTSLACEFPNPVFLQTEDGLPDGVSVTASGKINSYADLIGLLAELYEQPHDFETVVLDSITGLQPLVYAETCARGDDNGTVYDDVNKIPYGKGLLLAMNPWREVLAALTDLRNDRGMGYVILGHAVRESAKDPENPAYDRYNIAMQSSDKPNADARGMYIAEMDAVFFMKENIVIKSETKAGTEAKTAKVTARIRAEGGQYPIICTAGKPAYVAKSRFMPSLQREVRYNHGEGFNALAKHISFYNAKTGE